MPQRKPPTAPTALVVVGNTYTSVTVQWCAPQHLYGSRIYGYLAGWRIAGAPEPPGFAGCVVYLSSSDVSVASGTARSGDLVPIASIPPNQRVNVQDTQALASMLTRAEPMADAPQQRQSLAESARLSSTAPPVTAKFTAHVYNNDEGLFQQMLDPPPVLQVCTLHCTLYCPNITR